MNQDYPFCAKQVSQNKFQIIYLSTLHLYYILLFKIIFYFGKQRQMASRVRQFNDLRQSRSNKKDNLNNSFSSKVLLTHKSEVSKVSSANSHYVCINCINKQMSSSKKCQNLQREATERSRYNDLQKSRKAFEHDLALSREKKQEEDKRKISDFNKHLIETHQKQKANEQRQKLHARKKQEQNALLQQKILQQDLAKKQQAKNQFRNELQQQIQQKHEQKLREQMKSRYPEPLPQEQDWGLISRQQKQRYRQQLQGQIRESKQKKQRDRQNQSMINLQQQTFLEEQMASNNKRQRQTQEQMKRQLKQEQIQYKRQQQAKQHQTLRKLQQQKMQALINQEFMEKQQQQKQVLKNDRINQYKKDIEKQIKENQQRRKQQKNANKNGLYSTIGMTRAEIERKLCDSCEKTYPKKYMTKKKH